MKKYNILLITFLLSACSNNNENIDASVSDSSTTTEESSSVISSTTLEEESSISIEYEEYKFTNLEELYLDVNETYNLNKMISSSASVDIKSSNEEFVKADEGILTGMDYGDSTISIIRSNKKQDIVVHVVDYFEYGSYLTSTDIGRLYGKKAIFFGDSITHNWAKYTHDMEYTNGPDFNYPEYGWSGLLHEKCNFSKITNAACSGGTMGLPHDAAYLEGYILKSKSFPFCVNRNIEAVKEADYAFVFYGTNDYTIQLPLYSSGKNLTNDILDIDADGGSFAASMKYGIEKMQEVNPDIKIFFMNIMYRTYPANKVFKTEITIADYNKVINDVATSYLCRVLDTNCLFDKTNWSAHSSDGFLHINDKGHQVVADFILNNGEK